jgi:hypothetical protein
MGKASSAKKVARAARAGGRTNQGPKRQLAFPLSIAAIVVVGALLVVFARGANEEVAAESPTVGEHWHAAYGIYVCDAFLPQLTDQGPDTTGIHTHADGIVHVHPLANGAAGRNATLAKFGEMVGLEVDGSSFTVGDTTYADGHDCGGQPANVSLHVWSVDDRDAPPQVITDDIGSFRFDRDRLAVTLAVVPEGAEVPRPPTVGDIDRLDPVTDEVVDPTTTLPSSTPTTVAGAEGSEGGVPTESTVAGDAPSTETTVPGDSSTATTASTVTGAPSTTVAQ